VFYLLAIVRQHAHRPELTGICSLTVLLFSTCSRATGGPIEDNHWTGQPLSRQCQRPRPLPYELSQGGRVGCSQDGWMDHREQSNDRTLANSPQIPFFAYLITISGYVILVVALACLLLILHVPFGSISPFSSPWSTSYV